MFKVSVRILRARSVPQHRIITVTFHSSNQNSLIDKWLWNSYTQRRQTVSDQNWGIVNEMMAFMINPDELTSSNLHSFQTNGKRFSPDAAVIQRRSCRNRSAKSQMLLCRVAVGRVLDEEGKSQQKSANTDYPAINHSEATGKSLFTCLGACSAYPEYIITYEDKSPRPQSLPDEPHPERTDRSESKLCILCMERPVRYLTVPCGHPIICEQCNNPQIKRKFKFRCPECRSPFHQLSIIYGRVVND